MQTYRKIEDYKNNIIEIKFDKDFFEQPDNQGVFEHRVTTYWNGNETDSNQAVQGGVEFLIQKQVSDIKKQIDDDNNFSKLDEFLYKNGFRITNS